MALWINHTYTTLGRLSLPWWLNDLEQSAFQSECMRMLHVSLFFKRRGQRTTLVQLLDKDAHHGPSVIAWITRTYKTISIDKHDVHE